MQNQAELVIRVGDSTTDDYDVFARLLSAADGDNISGDVIRESDTNVIEGDIRLRYAACIDDEVMGYGIVAHAATAQKPIYTIWMTIDKDFRQQGYGSQFYDFLIAKALEHEAKELDSYCKDFDSASLTFAEKRGFKIRRHIYESILDLSTFDPIPYLSVVEDVKAQGIRFSSLADEGNTDEALYKLYELNAATARDNPSSDGTYKQTFENFVTKIARAHWFRPDGQLLAIDGERYVGLGAIGFDEDGSTTRNAFTGVDKDYRGRRIAQALKVLGARFAKEQGATRLITTNDSANAPMLAVNKKLGYQRTTGEYWLIKTI